MVIVYRVRSYSYTSVVCYGVTRLCQLSHFFTSDVSELMDDRDCAGRLDTSNFFFFTKDQPLAMVTMFGNLLTVRLSQMIFCLFDPANI